MEFDKKKHFQNNLRNRCVPIVTKKCGVKNNTHLPRHRVKHHQSQFKGPIAFKASVTPQSMHANCHAEVAKNRQSEDCKKFNLIKMSMHIAIMLTVNDCLHF